MKKIARQVHKLFIAKGRTIATAESCTGGLLSKLLTDIPESSRYFILGLVTYSNSAKEQLLGIPHNVLAKYGAVSKEVARLMASKVKRMAKTDFGIGITGIAGPGGKTITLKVGTVFICVDSKNKMICKKFIFRGSRIMVRNKAALETMKLLKSLL
jgi:PncC family amidohydrolase